MSKRDGFSTVKTDVDEIDEAARARRKRIWGRTLLFLAVTAVLAAVYVLISAIRSYNSFEVRTTIERNGSDAGHFESFEGNYLKYSNDGIVYISSDGNPLWNQSFEMTTPELEICGGYLAVYDKGGKDIYIFNAAGLTQHIETIIPIQTLCVASQGTVAVLMAEDTVSTVKLFDKNGKELVKGEYYGEQGGYPFDIALSSDAKKLAVDMININDGSVRSTITFYNFDSVGQNEIDNSVGTFTYADLLLADVVYVSKNCMLAFGDQKILIFEGDQKPKLKKELVFEEELESIFYDEKYFGVVYHSKEGETADHIDVYDQKGSKVMEQDTALAYNRIRFLKNHEICVTNDYECEIYTIYSIKKFAYQFEDKLYEILSKSTGRNYTFVFGNEIDEVRLQ